MRCARRGHARPRQGTRRAAGARRAAGRRGPPPEGVRGPLRSARGPLGGTTAGASEPPGVRRERGTAARQGDPLGSGPGRGPPGRGELPGRGGMGPRDARAQGKREGRTGREKGRERGREREGRRAHLGVQIRRSPSPKPRAQRGREGDGGEEVAAREKMNEGKGREGRGRAWGGAGRQGRAG
jgi:hypothetical protein